MAPVERYPALGLLRRAYLSRVLATRFVNAYTIVWDFGTCRRCRRPKPETHAGVPDMMPEMLSSREIKTSRRPVLSVLILPHAPSPGQRGKCMRRADTGYAGL